MIHLVREHFTANGVPKVSFLTRDQAFEFTKVRGDNQYPYLCSVCKYYHLAKRTRIKSRNGRRTVA